MSIVWFRPAVSPPITGAGSPRAIASFSPSRCWVESSVASLSPLSNGPSTTANWASTGISSFWRKRKLFASFLRPLFRQDWVVYCKPPFGGPEHVLRYLGRYTHRVAISNHRLVSLEGNQVTFRWRDSAHGNQQRLMTLAVEEFLRRFLLHVLPPGFVRIRHFGFLAHRRRAALLPLCFQFLGRPADLPPVPEPQPGEEEGSLDPPAFHFHVVLPPVRRPHDHSGATQRGGNAPAFSTAHSPEALMKYAIPIRSHRVRPPRPRSRVPGHMRSIHPSSPDPFTPSPRSHGLTGSTRVLARRQPFHFSLYPHGGSAEPHSKPIICPRPPQTRAAPFKSLYRKRAGQRLCHSGDWSRRRASDTALRLRGSRPVPTDHCFRRDDDEGLLPIRPDSPSNDPEEPVEGAQARPRMAPFQDDKLLA